jgi:hypothetical protein
MLLKIARVEIDSLYYEWPMSVLEERRSKKVKALGKLRLIKLTGYTEVKNKTKRKK